jgi:ribosomal subunit interface protein
MDIRVAGHQVDTGEALRSHVSDRLSAIADRYFSRAVAANVTFGRGPYEDFTCDIVAPVTQGVVLKSSAAPTMRIRIDGRPIRGKLKRMGGCATARRRRWRYNCRARPMPSRRTRERGGPIRLLRPRR